ncbi:winged helix-turn-helix domain-containing protein [Puniceibacterium confluentis]|uniref:winged helix-turn-helix domain-containing protein n=1 Tax=Puniceibacterium confluentis TaxID=1958944 RepID=UPI0011B7362C|nr:winged helix-turn-helix domain-containing protein [Puniceibacterium confluentis]
MSGNPPEKNLKNSEIISFGDFWFDTATLALFNIDWQPVPLRHQSALVLGELAKTPGEVVSKDNLVRTVWGKTFVSDDSLVQCIKGIRKAIRDSDRKIIRTVSRTGYRLDINQPAPATSLKPGILIDKIQCAGNSQLGREFAEDFRNKLVLVTAPRSGVRIFTMDSTPSSADYVVQGRASVSGDRIKLFLSLFEVKSRGHFYAESFDFDLSETHRLAEKVARKIASVLRISVITHDGERFADIPDDRLDLQQLLAKSHFFYSRVTVQDTMIARATIQAAVKMSPGNPKALALLAHSATQMHPLIRIVPSNSETDWAMSLADKAVAVGPSSSFAFRTRANLRLWLRGDHAGCRADCARALAINSNFYLAHLTLATSDILAGEHIAGIERMHSFVCLTTIDPQFPYFQSLIGLAWTLAGNADAAIQYSKEAHERSPKSSWHAMVYAVAASANPSIIRTENFRDMIKNLELPFGHFRSMPFSDVREVEALEARLRAAGVEEQSF